MTTLYENRAFQSGTHARIEIDDRHRVCVSAGSMMTVEEAQAFARSIAGAALVAGIWRDAAADNPSDSDSEPAA